MKERLINTSDSLSTTFGPNSQQAQDVGLSYVPFCDNNNAICTISTYSCLCRDAIWLVSVQRDLLTEIISKNWRPRNPLGKLIHWNTYKLISIENKQYLHCFIIINHSLTIVETNKYFYAVSSFRVLWGSYCLSKNQCKYCCCSDLTSEDNCCTISGK